jgi:hypothetical protein
MEQHERTAVSARLLHVHVVAMLILQGDIGQTLADLGTRREVSRRRDPQPRPDLGLIVHVRDPPKLSMGTTVAPLGGQGIGERDRGQWPLWGRYSVVWINQDKQAAVVARVQLNVNGHARDCCMVCVSEMVVFIVSRP